MTATAKKNLGSLISISKGKKHTISKVTSASSQRLLGIDDLRNDNLIRYTDDKFGTKVKPEDLLIAWDGANAGTIGWGKSGLIGSTIARLRLKEEDKLSTPFLGIYLKSKFNYLRETATGATIPHINRKALERIPLPEIELNDQKRIAHLLGKVEGLIAQRKQHLKDLDDLLKSVFLEMFGDPVRNEKGWDKGKICDLVDEVKYGTSASAKGGKYKYLRMNNITENGHWNFDSLKHIDIQEKDFEKYSLRKGDLVFNRTNSKELVGKTAVYNHEEPVIIAGYLIRVRVDKLNSPWFIWGHLNSKYGKTRLFNLCRNIVGMANINAKELQAIPILKPPLYLQNQFASIVEKVEGIKSRYQESLNDLENLYGALSQKTFAGELDLSRIPIVIEAVEKIEMKDEATFEKMPEIELPEYEDQDINTAEGRKATIEQWFSFYQNARADASIEVHAFVDLANRRLEDLMDEPTPIDVETFDWLSSQVWEQLKEGEIQQGYDDQKNTIKLTRS